MTIFGMYAWAYLGVSVFNIIAGIFLCRYLMKHDEIRVWHVVLLPIFAFTAGLNVFFACVAFIVLLIASIVHYRDIVEYPIKDIPKLWRKDK